MASAVDKLAAIVAEHRPEFGDLLGAPDLCRECDGPVDADGEWTGECYLGSGKKCDACSGCACDGSC